MRLSLRVLAHALLGNLTASVTAHMGATEPSTSHAMDRDRQRMSDALTASTVEPSHGRPSGGSRGRDGARALADTIEGTSYGAIVGCVPESSQRSIRPSAVRLRG